MSDLTHLNFVANCRNRYLVHSGIGCFCTQSVVNIGTLFSALTIVINMGPVSGQNGHFKVLQLIENRLEFINRHWDSTKFTYPIFMMFSLHTKYSTIG